MELIEVLYIFGAIASVISVVWLVWQCYTRRTNKSDDVYGTFSIKSIDISDYREKETHKFLIHIELTNENSKLSLAVNGVVLRFENGEEVTAHIDKKIQQAFYLAPKKRGELEVSIIDEKVQFLQGKKAVLTVYDTDDKPVSERITLKQDTYHYPSRRN
jgi:hypothetical protein